ncbi:MAG: DUF4861 domain-containing protein [Bacteroidaceae bacterium]|nr:DUF4861 domain-containing protein [Bacteroidaceae bacterium]
MKRIVSMGLMLQVLLAASAQSLTVKVTLTNDWKEDKTDEPVVVKLGDMKKVNFEVKSVSVKCKGKEIPCQLDDMDGNGLPDEVFFLADIKDKDTKTYEVKLSAKEEKAKKGEEQRIYTALQFSDKKDKHPDVVRVEASGKSDLFNDIYMHGVTLESDVVGYRIYFDHRQNIDLYGKKYRRIELPVTEFYTSEAQLKEGYGVDVLWAGDAIGCGSFKDWKKGKPENWTHVGVRGQRVVTTGPLRTVVEVYDLGVREEYLLYDMHQYYTLYAGHRDMQVEVQFTPSSGKKLFEKKLFCTGVQKVGETADETTRKGHKPQGFVKKEGLAASWGCDYPDMGKKQQWAPEAVGLAVYVPKEYVNDTKEDQLNYLYVVQPNKNHLRYYVSFCADKEENGFHTAKEWFASLDDWKDQLSHPVTVKVE